MEALRDNTEFSIDIDGPLYHLQQRLGVAGPSVRLAYMRILLFALVAWLPLLVLSAAHGDVLSEAKVPFLYDIEAHLRLLGAIPLLVLGELLAHSRLPLALSQFRERGLIRPEDDARFDATLQSAIRLRRSTIVEAALLLLAITAGAWYWVEHVSLAVPTWYGHVVRGHATFTPAGYWYACVSLPVFRFLSYRWYYRLFIWYRLLWQVSRLPLRLNGLHPDQAAGLGFLPGTVVALAPFLVSHTVLACGLIAGRILRTGARLPDFKMDTIALILFLLALGFAPLTFFAVQLAFARRETLRRFGALGKRYVDDFRAKWVWGEAPRGEALLGTADMQSLADLSNSYNVARQTRYVPFGRDDVAEITLLLLLPLLPLLLTMFSLEKLLEHAVKFVV